MNFCVFNSVYIKAIILTCEIEHLVNLPVSIQYSMAIVLVRVPRANNAGTFTTNLLA